MITQRHRYILLIIIIIYYCHHDSKWHHLSWVLIYILEQFLPLMYAGSAQFNNSLSVWVFWSGHPNWPSQTRFPRQWLKIWQCLYLLETCPGPILQFQFSEFGPRFHDQWLLSLYYWSNPKSPDTRTRDTKDTGIRMSDTDTVTPRIKTRRTRYIYIYIYIYIY